MKIRMLDDAGNDVGQFDAHKCTFESCGNNLAICEECGGTSTPENPVYVWTADIDFFACGICLEKSEYTEIVK